MPNTAATMLTRISALQMIPKSKSKKWRVWPGDGACNFPCDPEDKPRVSPALWSPLVACEVVTLETDDISTCQYLGGFEVISESASGGGRALVAAHGEARLRLNLRANPSQRGDRLIVYRDSNVVARLDAAAFFERVSRGGLIRPSRAARPTANRQFRLVLLLGIFDARSAGSTAREVAYSLIFRRHQPLSGVSWTDSSDRRQTLRLIAASRRMVEGGYHELLLRR
jgi:hypothetical protein